MVNGSPSPAAWEISVPETLELLDRDFRDVVDNISYGRFAFWLGSGVSFDRMPKLSELLRRVLVHLQEAGASEASPNRFSVALEEILALAQLSDEESASIDLSEPVDTWLPVDLVLTRLASVYAKVMNVGVDGELEDYLLWEAADAISFYADATVEPDVEHLCMAILVAEAVAPVIITANWDGLIESACDGLAGADGLLRVCVAPEDVRELKRRATLFKIHGCAVRAAVNDEDRKRLVVRQSQIDDWVAAAGNLCDDVVGFARIMPTIMIGLSAQDSNIKSVFSVAKNQVTWPWPGEYLAHVFAEDKLGADQKSILQFTYKDKYSELGAEIETAALLRAYGKPLLVALVLEVLAAKLQSLVVLAAAALGDGQGAALTEGILAIRDLLAVTGDSDRLEFVQELIAGLAEIGSMLVGNIPVQGTHSPYRPLSATPCHEIEGDLAVAAIGLPHAAVALALVGLGCKDGEWSVARRPGTSLALTNEFGAQDVFFAGTPMAEAALAQAGLPSSEDRRSIIVQSGKALDSLRRSPSASPGRTGLPSVIVVSMEDLLEDSDDASELFDRFRRAAVI